MDYMPWSLLKADVVWLALLGCDSALWDLLCGIAQLPGDMHCVVVGHLWDPKLWCLDSIMLVGDIGIAVGPAASMGHELCSALSSPPSLAGCA